MRAATAGRRFGVIALTMLAASVIAPAAEAQQAAAPKASASAAAKKDAPKKDAKDKKDADAERATQEPAEMPADVALFETKDDAATPLPAAPAAPEATPLSLKGDPKPLTLAEESPTSGIGYKLLLVAALAGAVVIVLKRKKKMAAPEAVPQLRVLTRASLGMRSELVVVEVDGTRLLLGVTPASIHALGDLEPVQKIEEAPVVEARPEREPVRVARREADASFAGALENLERQLERAHHEKEPAPKLIAHQGGEQARSLQTLTRKLARRA
jgi:flagellar biogenesis protein FliO